MGADCSTEKAPAPRSVRPSPVVSSIGDDRHRRGGGKSGGGATGRHVPSNTKSRARKSNDRIDDEFNFDFEFDYDLESLSSIERPKRKTAADKAGEEKERHVDPEPSLSSSTSSDESGCSGNRSFIGFVPRKKLNDWFDALPSNSEEFKPIKEETVWSDGEREQRQWLQTEASTYFYDDGAGGSGGHAYRPTYVSALGLQSEGEREEVEERRRLQRAQQQKHRQQQQRAAKKKTQVSRCG